MDRRLFLHIQGGRQISGVLRGFDMFLNLVVDQAFEELGAGQRKPCGMVVSHEPARYDCGSRVWRERVIGGYGGGKEDVGAGRGAL